MEGTPGPGYDLDDSSSVYNASGDAGATPAMNDEAQDSHAHDNEAGGSGQKANNATHMRSRITVVCGECKRLKLKCDRRTPCGSCTKRDTMSRCIYSQAAAEKIDVQSLHNRLLVVEGQVASLTTASAASNPSIPPFKSSYPAGSQPNGASSPQGADGGRPRRGSSGAALGGVPCNDRYLLVSGASGSSLVINLEDTSGIWLDELEAQLGGIEDSSLTRTTSISPYAVARPSGSSGSNKVKLEPTPVVLSTTPSTSTTPSNASSESAAWNGKPTNFGTISGFVAPIPYETFLVSTDSGAPGTSRSHMFSAIPEYNGSPPPAPPEFPQVTPALLRYLPSAPVRARYLDSLCEALKVHPSINVQHFQQRVEAMCIWGENNDARAKSDLARDIFGSGAGPSKPAKERAQAPSPKPTLSFFAAASVALALGSIMTHENDKPPLGDCDPIQRNTPAGLFALSKQALQLFEETNPHDLDSVITMLLQVLFLMHDGQMRISHMVFPLVGKMINVARMMGLAIDPDEFQGTYSLFEAETRRRVWWDIFYYDMVVSECMGHQSLIHENSFTTKIPANVDEERFSPSSTMLPVPEEGSNTSIVYFLLRCKALLLVKNIRRQITRDLIEDAVEPSVDQASSYEKEVMSFLAELPAPYRLNMDLDMTQPFEDDPVLLAQRSAICIVANRIAIKLYLPFMKDMSEGSLAKTSHQAVLGTINAAHSIIYASRVLFTVWRDKRPGIFEYYDYTRSLFDAAVICAQAVIQQPSSLLAGDGMKGITHALEIMKLMTSPTADNSGVAADAIKMVEMMKEKAERARATGVTPDSSAAAGTKRKRSDGELHRVATLTTGFTLPFVGPSVSSVKPPRSGQLMMSKIASGSTKTNAAIGVESRASSSSSSSSKSSKDKEKSREKVKYPSIGIRVRHPAGQPPAVRQRTGSTPSVSPPTPVVAPPAHSQSSGSAAPTPVSDRSAVFTYPPPQAHTHPSAPHPMEAMQHDFQMEYSQGATADGTPMDGSRYSRSYASSPQTSSSLYDRQSPYATTHPTPTEPFRPPHTPQEYYLPPYPPPGPPYEPGSVEMGPFPANGPLASSMPGTPREAPRYLPADKAAAAAAAAAAATGGPYDPRIGKAELQRQMGHEYQHTATAHGIAMTATQMSAPYVQGWQPAEIARPDDVPWDYPKYYSQNPP